MKKKASGLCNPETNHVYKKRLPNYVINFKKDFQIT